VTIKSTLGIEFVFVPGGSYQMGHIEHRKPVSVQHVDGFWITKFEVTNEQFEALGKHVRAKESLADNMPATSIWRSDAESFAERLSSKDGRRYRLPTEKEWEYAARGGHAGANYPWGSAPLDGRMNSGTGAATPVGEYLPNDYGLFDMTGNAAEYVQENYWDEETLSSKTAPRLWMARGGSFSDWNGFVWYADPVPVDQPRAIYNCYGFRLVLEAPPPAPQRSKSE
jgi:formylglycine-generating enzyme required for sulfatase activity